MNPGALDQIKVCELDVHWLSDFFSDVNPSNTGLDVM
jgi:hypothetical protein